MNSAQWADCRREAFSLHATAPVLHGYPSSAYNIADLAQSSRAALFGFDLGFTTNLLTRGSKEQA